MRAQDLDWPGERIVASLLAYDEALAGESSADWRSSLPPRDEYDSRYFEALRATVDRLELARLAQMPRSAAADDDPQALHGEHVGTASSRLRTCDKRRKDAGLFRQITAGSPGVPHQ